MEKHKKLTSKSGITIPKDMREQIGFRPGMAVDLITTREGVIIKAHTPVCRFCGLPEGLIIVEEIHICAECAGKVLKGVQAHG